MKRTLPLLMLSLALGARAQDLKEVKARFPSEDLVILQYQSLYRISVVNDSIQVTGKDAEDWMYLTEKGSRMKTEGWISHSGFRELGEYEAFTRTPPGKKLQVTDVKTTGNKDDGVFYDDSKLTTFKYPGLAEGAVTHLEYVLNFKEPSLLSPHVFSRGAATLHNELRIVFPKTVKVRYAIMGEKKDKVSFRQENGRNETRYIFSVDDMPREESYPDAVDRSCWATQVVFFVEQYQKADGSWVNFLSSPADLYARYAAYTAPINREMGNELAHITDSLAKGLKGDAAKAAAIYRWVQGHVKYVAFEEGMEGYVPRDANLVCSRRFGDCKDFASILTAMLRHAGLKAYFTWIGTRHLPYTYEQTPTPVVDNHMICTLDLDGKYIFLDGTDNTCVFGWPADHIQGKEAMVGLDAQHFKIVTVPVMPAADSKNTDTTFLQFTANGVKGRIHDVLTGYSAMDVINQLNYRTGKDRAEWLQDRLSRGSNKFKLLSYRITDSSATGDRIGITAEFEIPDYGRSLAGDRFINLNLFRPYEHMEIDIPRRQIPIGHRYNQTTELVSILEVPQGYRTDYLPPSSSYHNPTWGYDIIYKEEGGRILFSQRFTEDHIVIGVDRFKEWNQVLEKLQPQYKETVSLTPKH